MVKKINSRNAEFQKFQVLKTNRNKRHKYGEFFVEGVRNINGAVEGGWKITSFLYTREKPLSGWAEDLLQKVATQVNYQLTAGLMEELSGKTDTSELMAVVRMRPDDLSALPLSDNPCLVLFDRASNRGNLGTILRSCDALGADGLILTGHGVDGDQIILEDRSSNTWENIQYTLDLFQSGAVEPTGKILAVSNGFHLSRIRMLWGREWEGTYTLSTLAAPSSHLPSRLSMYLREPLALAKSWLLDR